jgi:hypothetical protein
MSPRGQGCLGALSAFGFGAVFILIIVASSAGAKSFFLWQAVSLVLLFGAILYGLRRSPEYRDFYLGGMIGLGILGLLWGICVAGALR